MIICITGVAGVGKTTIAKKLAERINAEYINLLDFAKEKKLIVSYDEALQTYIVDEDKLIEEIKKYLKNEKNYVIDGNFSHLIPSDIYIVIRTDPNILYSRLLQRGYSYNKIFENIWAMNLEVIEEEIENMGKEYYVFNNNTENDIEIIVNSIIEIINKNKIIL
ncbi:MAG: adenylate kinase family protein [Nanopusillaceae archaeon]